MLNYLKKWSVFGLVLIAPGLTSCGDLEKIEIGDPREVKIRGFEDNYLNVFVGIPVNNPSFYKIKITDIDVRVYVNGSYIGKLMVDETVVVKRKESRIYELPVKIRLSNVLGAAFLMMNMKQGQELEVRFDGVVTGKSMLVKKSFEIDETKKILL